MEEGAEGSGIAVSIVCVRACDSVLFVRGGLGVKVVLLCISAMNVICTIQLSTFKYQ